MADATGIQSVEGISSSEAHHTTPRHHSFPGGFAVMRTQVPRLWFVLLALASFALPVQAQVTESPKLSKKTSAVYLKRAEILQLLTEEIDPAPLMKTPLRLVEFLNWLQASIEARRGVVIPLFLDTDAFKAENPAEPPVQECLLKFAAPLPRKVAGDLLGLGLDRVPTNNASFLVRQGRLEITTDERAYPFALLRERVFGSFKNSPCIAVLADLAEQTGITFTTDPQVFARVNTPVTANFVNNTSLETAVIVLTNMVGVEPVLLGDVLYITTPKNAQMLRPLQFQLQPGYKKHWKKAIGPAIPGLG
jgi:hypothetical protein